MLKPDNVENVIGFLHQPPSGGCVLKPTDVKFVRLEEIQPPSGGCVLKQFLRLLSSTTYRTQPPSGGCVLKLLLFSYKVK